MEASYIKGWALAARHALVLLLSCAMLASASAAEPMLKTWTVDGLQREALVCAPAKPSSKPAPVVFVFHGHGGTARRIASVVNLQALWPEALVIYMQGLPTATPLVDAEGRFPGWQTRLGSEGDRDLHFFDTALASLEREYRVDALRVYATGHSNGGVFTYVLMAARPDTVAAYAPSAAVAPEWSIPLQKPKPVFHIAGQEDTLVRYEWQRRTLETVRVLNRASLAGKPWAQAGGVTATLYPSQTGAPLIVGLHPGGHQFPEGAAALIVRFFKEQGGAR